MKILLLLFFMSLLTLLGCNSSSNTDQPPDNNEIYLSQSECESHGGKWFDTEEYSTLDKDTCELVAKDAGKICTDNSDCEKYCGVIEGNEKNGTCGDYYSHVFGCSSTWVNGEIKTTCIDL